MIISRTPFRISFFGGGTDFPIWYREHGGAVLSTSFDKYCYVTCRELPPFFEHNYRIAYSVVESVKNINDIQHPAVRSVLSDMGFDNKGLEIHVDADLPARSGLGSSSSFVVGLLNSLFALQGKRLSKYALGLEAIRIEQNVINENVGSQDQIAAAHGGLNIIRFRQDENIFVEPVIISSERKKLLNDHLMLFFTGFSRISSEIVKEQISNIEARKKELASMKAMVDEAGSILSSNCDLVDFGKLLHEAWLTKRSLSTKITSPQIDDIYSMAISEGAIGGKILGAGGGGFMLIFAKPEQHHLIRKKLSQLIYVPIKFETSGSQIIYYEP